MIEKITNLIKNNLFICELILSIFLTFSILAMFDLTTSEEFFLMAIIGIAIFTIIHFSFKNFDKKRLKYSLFFSIPFGICFWLGKLIVVYQQTTLNTVTFSKIIILIALIIVFTLMSICVLSFIDKNRILRESKQKIGRKGWLIYALIIFLCWLPLFLIFFPGFISVDSAVQISQAVGERVFSNWHPVLHTLFVSIFVNIGKNIFGSLTAGIALYTIAQMVALSLIYGYITKWSIEQTSKKWIGYLLMAFFAFCPTVACYSITMWKDIIFSSLFALLIIKGYDFIREIKDDKNITFKQIAKLVILALLVAFLRNGGILILITLGIVFCVYYKKNWKKFCLIFSCATLSTIIIQGPVYKMLGINGSPFVESMSIPIQQIGYVASIGELSDDEKEELSKFADVQKLSENYTPMDADPAKNSCDYDIVEADKIGFLKIWFKMLPNHLGSFIKAYVLQTHSYWYIQGPTWDLDLNYNHNDMWLQEDWEDVALLGNTVRNYVAKIELGLTKTIFFGWTNTVGVLFWGIIYSLIIFCYQKRTKILIPMACVVVYMLSLLIAAPISWVFRYIYSLLLILPALIVIVFKRDDVYKLRK